MAEEMNKVYCMDRPNDSYLLAELMNSRNQGTDAATMSALFSRNNDGSQWNNPFMYLIWLALLGGRNGGIFGGGSDCAVNGKLDALSTQMQTNQNTNLAMDAINGNHEALHSLSTNLNVGFANLDNAICGVQNAITKVGGEVGMTGQQVINAVLMGNKDLTAALQSCCCENKQLVMQMGYETQLRDQTNTCAITTRIAELANGVQTGFANIGYQASQNTNAIIQAGNANTQRIVDTMNAHWNAELQQKYNDARLELSQQAQTNYLISQLKTTA